jgi:class 3 adenylate cyclase
MAVHFGEVTAGPMGHKRQLDLTGETVNITATMGGRPFALSQQAFRQLTPEHRQLFRRFTPSILYLPAADR